MCSFSVSLYIDMCNDFMWDRLKIVERVIMGTQTITNAVRSSAFPPVCYVVIVLRYKLLDFSFLS